MRLIIVSLLLLFVACNGSSNFDNEIDRFVDNAGRGYIGELKSALKNGVDINGRNVDGFLALSNAVLNGRTATVEFLIGKGVDVNRCDSTSTCLAPLHWAAVSNNKIIAEKLVKAGANVNIKNKLGWTPLMYTALKNSALVADLLIKSGADATMKNADGMDAVDIANKKGNSHIEIVLAATREIQEIKRK